MPRSTFISRFQSLTTNVFEAMGGPTPPTVKSGCCSTRWCMCPRASYMAKPASNTWRFSIRNPESDAILIASVIVAIAKAHGCNARWEMRHPDHLVSHLVLTIRPGRFYGPRRKVSECLLGLDQLNYGALAGFDACTNYDLQLFNAQGLNQEDARTVLNLVNQAN